MNLENCGFFIISVFPALLLFSISHLLQYAILYLSIHIQITAIHQTMTKNSKLSSTWMNSYTLKIKYKKKLSSKNRE